MEIAGSWAMFLASLGHRSWGAALAARGLTVAELPKEFLKELRQGNSEGVV